ncbi:MAG: helix-turn-helix domain-containing protein [Deltaproteobacteria bacterium]|nr:helix-turn-helix domain-containing protein [Deltaproteobacteria bacterium]
MANIVTARELGQYLKLSESTIYKLSSDGNLPGFKIGDSWRFDMDEVIKAIRKAKKGNDKKAGNTKKERR